MIEAGGSFGFAAKAFQLGFSGPRTQADHLQRDGAIETSLARTINHPLTAAANFLQQFIIPNAAEYVCPPRDGLAVANCPRSLFFIQYGLAIIADRISALGYEIVIDQPKAGS